MSVYWGLSVSVLRYYYAQSKENGNVEDGGLRKYYECHTGSVKCASCPLDARAVQMSSRLCTALFTASTGSMGPRAKVKSADSTQDQKDPFHVAEVVKLASSHWKVYPEDLFSSHNCRRVLVNCFKQKSTLRQRYSATTWGFYTPMGFVMRERCALT